MNVRTPIIVTVVAAAALTGCSSTTTSTSSAPTNTTPAATPTTTTPAAAATTSAATTPPATSSTSKPAAADGCTPSEATLLKALSSSKIGEDLAPTKTLTDITCYQGYALGLTHPKEADNARVVYQYTGGAWTAVSGGTSGYCDGLVPADVQKHLKNC
ncbi:hypothetical protein Q0Z83_023720 [Actinoplanes sichuanensis]|uniref:Uncharacterized protein n=1 Tax=Actinoplanes sichuanensis TaxID=512349 RepID=A0ABW4A1Z7_9ACTN|nr:hypothetical protein [Actinoplanes sichuanensis]BEL04181.1 hypothetical protein Q0Z83_023720 [Actinoplanes sichuanensis]